MKLYVVFYHPKDPKNVEDIACIAERLGAELIVVERPGGPNLEGVTCRFVSLTLQDAIERVSRCFKILLETYGFHYLDEVEVPCNAECVALIVGAEDYGIPRHVAERFEPNVVARIPMRAEGMSYNVAASTTMGLTEVTLQCRKSLQ